MRKFIDLQYYYIIIILARERGQDLFFISLFVLFSFLLCYNNLYADRFVPR